MPASSEPPLPLGGALPLGGWVTAHLVDGTAHRGVLHTVDPETGTLILLRPSAGDPDLVAPLVVFLHALASLEQHGTPAAGPSEVALEPLRLAGSSAAAKLDAAGVAARRDALCALLQRRRVPFESSGDDALTVLGCLRVSAPYAAHACQCENETVLGRFLALLEELDAET